ncbi:hypothetical protein ACFFX0_20740 [Citricoccus parietis]|uniref:Uncharacterized protein n=1 Tax=Citricoccus parietis TaxID=592307 RepID=A0ABV5G3G5_9MICC
MSRGDPASARNASSVSANRSAARALWPSRRSLSTAHSNRIPKPEANRVRLSRSPDVTGVACPCRSAWRKPITRRLVAMGAAI